MICWIIAIVALVSVVAVIKAKTWYKTAEAVAAAPA